MKLYTDQGNLDWVFNNTVRWYLGDGELLKARIQGEVY